MRNAAAAVLFFLACGSAAGQATPTATQTMRLQTYALGSYTTPTVFGHAAEPAATVGTNLNIFHFGRVQPGIDARLSTTFGPQRQTFLGGGPRVQVDFGRIHPYADFLYGHGMLSFNSGNSAYTHDNANVTSFGGGVDFSLGRAWGVRVDVQRQNWMMGGPERFSPTTVSVGLRYQLHFRNHHGPE